MGFGARNVPGLWFETLEKPFFNPPGWVFAPVWIVLYTQMAIAAWLVWRPDGFRGSARFPLVIYLVQLLFNALWPWLFFGLHRMDWALTDILALFVLLVLLVPAFYREHRTAGWLLLPYVVWIGFATLLNTAFLRMNG